MRVNSLSLAWQFHNQEKRYKHLQFLRWTQALLMIFIVTLNQTGSSIQTFLTENLNALLGADAVISFNQSLSAAQLSELQRFANKTSSTQSITTTLTHGDNWQRTRLKGVDGSYPLQGEVTVAEVLGGTEQVANSGPSSGEIWLDSRLLGGLGIDVGQSISLADQSFTVTRVLLHEPDRLMEGHNVDMRALVNLADFRKLQFPKELVQYRYLIAATSTQIDQLIEWQKQSIPAAQLVHKQGAHPLALFWQRTENFFGLASIILFFMAAIAIEQLTRVQTHKEQHSMAVSMSLGASKGLGFQISLFKWLIRSLGILPVVIVFSGVGHAALIHWLADTFEGMTWQWDISEMFSSLAAVFCILLVFQLPVWLGLKQSSVAQLLSGVTKKNSYGVQLVCASIILFGVAYYYSDNGLLTIMVLGAMLVSIILILLVSWLVLTIGERLTQSSSGLIPFALFMMRQRLVNKSTQILGVGLCAFLLLFTLMLMRDLGDTMSAYQREHDGNLLVSQAKQEQRDFVKVWAEQNVIQIRQEKPFMYAKLVDVNGQFLNDAITSPSESLATFQRPIRLHWTNAIPNNNRLTKGEWWESDQKNWQVISIEEEVMLDLGLSIGDTLTFVVGQRSIAFEIVASHAYRSGAGSITFWVQMPAQAIEHLQGTHFYMASLELAPHQFNLLKDLWEQFPSLRMTSLQELTSRFDNTLAMITKVIAGFATLIILLAFIVIFSTCHALEEKEKKKNSIIMSFGFNQATCFKLNVIEWLTTGLVAALGAIVGTYVGGLMIYQSQFSLTYSPNVIWLIFTLSVIMAVVTFIGIAASRGSLTSSVRELLKEL